VRSTAYPSEASEWPADRTRQGVYAQLSYRPSELDRTHLSRLEGVVRYDQLDGITGGKPTRRTTVGLDYWVQPSLVVKAAFQVTDPYSGDNTRRSMVQLAGGF
jgi:hypothetical protein